MILAADPSSVFLSQENRSLIHTLLERGLLDEDQVNILTTEYRISGQSLESLVVDLGFVSGKVLAEICSEIRGFPFVDLQQKSFCFQTAQKIPYDVSFLCLCVALSFDSRSDVLSVAMSDPSDLGHVDYLRSFLPKNQDLQIFTAEKSMILDWLYHYHLSVRSQDSPPFVVLESAHFSELLSELICDAVLKEASDIHFQPEKVFMRVRYRCNGILRTVRCFHQHVWSSLCVQLKVLGGMDIAESRRPQDGRFHLKIMERWIEFRLSSHPTCYGESLVVRLLDSKKGHLSLEKLGFDEASLAQTEALIAKPHGLLVVAGPTGSGKSTSLYALLGLMSAEETNILTLEEPIEYHMQGVRQSEVREGSLSFAEGMRSLLRQDPDVILLGEIRDQETAEISLRAGMTGHKVLTTVHAYNPFAVVDRFLDLDVSSELLSHVLNGVISQRLLRVLCEACKQPDDFPEKFAFHTKLSGGLAFKAVGCKACDGTGYRGRKAVAEIWTLSDEDREMVLKGKTSFEMQKKHEIVSHETIFSKALKWVENGKTTLEEVARSMSA
jgi:type II secretory ATPase GspE/PulE/Tfp pilus assembly ATPase PilB-like protein